MTPRTSKVGGIHFMAKSLGNAIGELAANQSVLDLGCGHEATPSNERAACYLTALVGP